MAGFLGNAPAQMRCRPVQADIARNIAPGAADDRDRA